MKSIKIKSKQPNIMVKYNGVKYRFDTEAIVVPADVASYFINKGIVKKVGKVNNTVDMDLNGDGVFDKKDKTIASAVMRGKIKKEDK